MGTTGSKKEVAKSLTGMLGTEIMSSILDRRVDISSAIEEVQGFWGFDLMTRKPGPAYRDGVFVGTDLDLACFLYELAERGAVINLPTYKSFRQTHVKEGQHLVSKANRHGKLLGVGANIKTFGFSVLVFDQNVMTEDSTGDFRNFAITDMNGKFYEGWRTIEFVATAEENEFIRKTGILSGNNKIVFKNFVHPNRWTSFFGQYYFLTKALIDRITEERKHLKSEIDRIIELGARYPKSSSPEIVRNTEAVGEAKSVKIKSFEVEVDVPDYIGEYPKLKVTTSDLVAATDRVKMYNKVLKRLRFMTRLTEFAFSTDTSRLPGWIKNTKVEEDYVVPGKRTKWNRIVLFQPGVGEFGVSIRWREYEKSERVSEDYLPKDLD